MKYILELSEEQAKMIRVALEEYFRIRMNQWNTLADDLAFAGFDYKNHTKEQFNARIESRNAAEVVLRAASDVAYPGRMNGVYPPQTREMMLAQDIWQVVRYTLWKDKHGDKDDWCVDAREPRSMTGEKLPTMRGQEE